MSFNYLDFTVGLFLSLRFGKPFLPKQHTSICTNLSLCKQNDLYTSKGNSLQCKKIRINLLRLEHATVAKRPISH